MKSKDTQQNNAKLLQKAFFNAAGPSLLLLKEMLDHLPNVAAYIKDEQGRFMAMNRRNCEQCGFAHEDEVIGKRSCDLFPSKIACYIMSRDRHVLKTGKPIINRCEKRTATNPANNISISIYPIRNSRGHIIGTAACYYSAKFHRSSIPNASKISKIVDYLNRHYSEAISIQDIPNLINISSATFHRTFTAVMNVTPGRYLSSLRINHARHLLETTDLTITNIAQECGFYDHSHFVRIFRHEHGITPGEYRHQHLTRK